MSSITIIGTGNMARTIGQLATAGGNTVEIMGRDQPKAADLAKASVAAFVESLGLRPLDVGGLDTAHWLEGASLVEMGLARNGVGHYDFALGVSLRAAAR